MYLNWCYHLYWWNELKMQPQNRWFSFLYLVFIVKLFLLIKSNLLILFKFLIKSKFSIWIKGRPNPRKCIHDPAFISLSSEWVTLSESAQVCHVICYDVSNMEKYSKPENYFWLSGIHIYGSTLTSRTLLGQMV